MLSEILTPVLEFQSIGWAFPVDEPNRSTEIVRFGTFEADLRTGELQKNGLRVPLQGQPFQVLAILLQHSGKLVTREELHRKVWPEDTFVDFDHGLNTAITKIRTALGDDADNPRFVETFPRRGYRFIAPVDKPSSQLLSPNAQKEHFQRLTAGWRWVGVGVAALVLFSVLVIWRLTRKPAEARLPSIEVVPLVAVHGMQGFPAFSPDGNQVAFMEIEGGKGAGIYTTLIGGEKPLRLTDNPGDSYPTWSPDSRQIAFLRVFEKEKGIPELGIYVVPALGGTQHRLYMGPHSYSGGLDWSPDGSALVFPESSPNDVHSWIALLSLADLTTRPLTSPPPQERDLTPAFSPDGSKVVFARGSFGSWGKDLFVVPVAGGEPKRLTFDNTSRWPVWTPNGREIVFSSRRGGPESLWRIPASGGTPQPVAGVGEMAGKPSISRKGNQLVYQHGVKSSNIWRINPAIPH
jgi:DNA-binding winged helix-turn-helix (wHTH) protein